jgi:hypothetical protein
MCQGRSLWFVLALCVLSSGVTGWCSFVSVIVIRFMRDGGSSVGFLQDAVAAIHCCCAIVPAAGAPCVTPSNGICSVVTLRCLCGGST